MKKILILNTNFNHGGAAMVANKLFHHAQTVFGIEQIFFAYGRGKKNNDPHFFYFGNKLETIIHVFLVRFFGLEGFGSFWSTRKLIKFIEKEKFDLIHIHNLHGYYVNFFKLLTWLNKKNIKVIWTLHDEWLLTWLPAHSMGCRHCKGEKIKCVNRYDYPKNYFPIFKSLMLKLKKKILNYNNIVFITPADWLFDKIKTTNPNAKVKLINNGVDVDLFCPRDKTFLKKKYNLPVGKKIILFSAADLKNKNKGINFILEMIKESSKAPYYFVNIGAGNLPKFSNLTSFGRISDENKSSQIYALADIYITSSLAETASLSVLEALASGLPVFAFDIPANGFLVEYQCGIIIAERSGHAMINEINSLLSSPERLGTMSDNARKLVVKKYNYNLVVNEYLNLYKIL